MTVKDTLIRALLEKGQIRALVAVTTNTVETGRTIHGTCPTATAAFGRCLTAAAMLGAMLKDNESVLLQIDGDGPIGQIVAQSDSKCRVRGYVQNPKVHLPLNDEKKLAVGAAVGKGKLHVIRQLGMKEPYHGTVNLVTGEIGDDLAYYFAASEQIPSVIGLGVLVDKDGATRAAGGIIMQLLPGFEESIRDLLEMRVKNIPPISRMIDNGKSPLSILHMVGADLEPKIIAEHTIEYYCGCSRERFKEALLAVGEEELSDIIEKDGGAELICHFCRTRYEFNRQELEELLEQAK